MMLLVTRMLRGGCTVWGRSTHCSPTTESACVHELRLRWPPDVEGTAGSANRAQRLPDAGQTTF
jgi:hypothetical protein